MINIVRASDLWLKPILAATMYADRRKQFRERMGWPVHVDSAGFERDSYDSENPIYVILEGPDGTHCGSLRLLPTMGKTMITDHFFETLAGLHLPDPRVWECTRFCLSPGQNRRTAVTLLAATASIMAEAGLTKLVAIFDSRMLRLYRKLGVGPAIIGSHTYSFGEVVSGYWSFDKAIYGKLLEASELDPENLATALKDFAMPWMFASLVE